MKRYGLAIVGGGASGLYLAALLANKNISVAVIESGERVGRKLSATGNGQGNLTNANISSDNYFGDKELIRNVLGGGFDVLSVFPMLFSADELGRVYPTGRQASSLTDALRKIISDAENIDLITSAKVNRIDVGYKLFLDAGVIEADRVALCTGGKSQKQFGSDGNGYALAARFGHKITPLFPSLVQLRTETEKIRSLKGLRADCIAYALHENKTLCRARGDVIFTEYGVTGNAVFRVSPYLTDVNDAEISIEFLPGLDENTIARDVRRKAELGYGESEWLSGTLNNQIGRAIVRASARRTPEGIARTVKNFVLKVTGTLGFDYAQVTRGGISTDGVTEYLESKYSPGLYFAGEILDVDGECGGYNLHWAFSSAHRVSEAILRSLR